MLAVGCLVAGCGTTMSGAASGLHVVVAAESFWGSIATQLAGSEATVQSIIVNPAQDPHSYEPTAADARMLATAQLAIVNGIGYDPWASRLLAANPASGRIVLTVGDLFGLGEGQNPHRWYDPTDVEAVANAITGDLKRLDPKHAPYYDRQLSGFEGTRLEQYHHVIAAIRKRYAGVAVGASESIFALQAPALGLPLLTPPDFMKAISEGTDVSARDAATVEQQITRHEIKLWVYNSQNATPEIQHLNALARQYGIPIATVTETLSPANDNFEQWQLAQLLGIQRALHQATGR